MHGINAFKILCCIQSSMHAKIIVRKGSWNGLWLTNVQVHKLKDREKYFVKYAKTQNSFEKELQFIVVHPIGHIQCIEYINSFGIFS